MNYRAASFVSLLFLPALFSLAAADGTAPIVVEAESLQLLQTQVRDLEGASGKVVPFDKEGDRAVGSVELARGVYEVTLDLVSQSEHSDAVRVNVGDTQWRSFAWNWGRLSPSKPFTLTILDGKKYPLSIEFAEPGILVDRFVARPLLSRSELARMEAEAARHPDARPATIVIEAESLQLSGAPARPFDGASGLVVAFDAEGARAQGEVLLDFGVYEVSLDMVCHSEASDAVHVEIGGTVARPLSWTYSTLSRSKPFTLTIFEKKVHPLTVRFAEPGVMVDRIHIKPLLTPAVLAALQAVALPPAAPATPAAVVGSAPLKWGGELLRRKPAWYATAEARAAADSVLRYQSSVGAWPKNTDLLAPVTPAALREIEEGGKANTIDNGATTVPLRFLALVGNATADPRYHEGALRGLDYLLAAQYPNGGFPQFYPLRKGYYAHITYNDGAMINTLELLREVAQGREPFAFIGQAQRARAADAVARGIDCILKTQIVQEGKLTVWCAQHDEVTLAPAWARKYEPPSFSGSESVGIVRFLMAVEQPSPGIVAAVEGAVAWFRAVPITGQRLDRVRHEDGRSERLLVADPTAPPLWARFYELGTNRPLYLDRDSALNYDYQKVSYERRSGYSYHTTGPGDLLERDYPKWRARLKSVH